MNMIAFQRGYRKEVWKNREIHFNISASFCAVPSAEYITFSFMGVFL